MNEVGKRVRKRRTALKLTQEELAALTGLDDSYISLLERGQRRNPGLDTLQKLAHALQTSISYLIGETDDEEPLPKIAAHQQQRPGTPSPAHVQLVIERAIRNAIRELDELEGSQRRHVGEEKEEQDNESRR